MPAPDDDSPMIMPLTPLARSRIPSGTRMVTVMGSAMVRMLLMITPTRMMLTKLHSHRLDAALNAPAGAAR